MRERHMTTGHIVKEAFYVGSTKLQLLCQN